MKETIASDSRPKRQEQIIVQKGSNDVLLFSMEDGSYYALNEVGNRIWELCDGTHEVAQLISILAKEYEPSLAATASCGAPAVPVIVTFAPGTIAPDSSVTTPRNSTVCASSVDAEKSAIAI